MQIKAKLITNLTDIACSALEGHMTVYEPDSHPWRRYMD